MAVSVIVPAYRQAAFLEGCLDSIARQGHDSLEVIVVDDGCPEGSGEVAERHPSRPRVIRQPNGGVAAARNRGIEESHGALIAFLDADDRWRPDKLVRQLAVHDPTGGPLLSFTRYRRVGPAGRPLEPHAHPAVDQVCSARRLLAGNFIGCSTVVVARACLEQVGGFPDSPDLRRGGQDYALWLRVAARYPLRYLPEVLTDYTIHPGNRVGADAVRHFEGWAHGVQALAAWDRGRFLALSDGAPARLVAQRARRMAVDVARSPGQWGRALRAFGAGLTRVIWP